MPLCSPCSFKKAAKSKGQGPQGFVELGGVGMINDVNSSPLWFGSGSSDPSSLLISVINNFGG